MTPLDSETRQRYLQQLAPLARAADDADAALCELGGLWVLGELTEARLAGAERAQGATADQLAAAIAALPITDQERAALWSASFDALYDGAG
jgi:hypothetical protein